MHLKMTMSLLVAVAFAGCRPPAHTSIEDIAQKMRGAVLPGWTVSSSSSNTIVVSTEHDVTIVGRLGNGPNPPDEEGYKTRYCMTFRFVPLLTGAELRELENKRAPFLYTLDHGAASKTEYVSAMRGYESNLPPVFFNSRYSIFIDRPIDRFVFVRPTNTVAEAEAILSAFGGFVKPYGK